LPPTVLALVLAACTAQDADLTSGATLDTASPDAPESTSDDTGAPACDVEVLGVWPVDGAGDVSVAEAVEVWFDAPVEGAQVDLIDATGKSVPGHVSSLDDRFGLRLVPDAALAYDAEHEVVVTACGDTWGASFVTLPEPSTWEGYEQRAYVVSLDELQFDEPAVLSELIGFLGMDDLLAAVWVEAVDVEARTVELAVAAAGHEEGVITQDACEEVAVLAPADFTGNPAFSAGPGDLGFMASGVGYTFRSLSIEGRFAGDGDAIASVTVEGWLDLSELSFDSESGCSYLGHFGLPCEACPDDAGEDCLHVAGTAVDAPWEPQLAIDLDVAECG